jgi:putative intracellular protease/amidase
MLLPGGIGTMPELENEALLSFLRERAASTEITMSVCTGSALLAKAGVLDGHRATANKQFFMLAASQSDKVQWIDKARWVEDGKFATSLASFFRSALKVVPQRSGQYHKEDILGCLRRGG